MSRFSGFASGGPPTTPDEKEQRPRSAFSGFSSQGPPGFDNTEPELPKNTLATTPKANLPGAADDLQPVDENRGPGRPAEKSGDVYSTDELLNIKSEAERLSNTAKAGRVDDVLAIRETEGIPGEDPETTKKRKLRETFKGATFEYDGQQIPAENLFTAAENLGVDPETILRSGSTAGKFQARIAKTVVGQTLLRAEAGLSDIAHTALSLGARAVGAEATVQNLKRSQALNEEYLNLINKGSDLEFLLGERGNRIYNGVVQSVAKVAATGAVGGVVAAPGSSAILSGMAAENLDTGLNDADDLGLEGSSRRNYALRKAGIETAITFGMGRIGKRLGIGSVEEMLSPGMRQAAANLFAKSGAGARLAKIAGLASSVGMEAGEEMLVDVVSQLNETNENGESVDYTRIADAGMSGAAGGAGVNLITSFGKSLGGKLSNQNLEDTVTGVKAAEAALKTTTKTASKTAVKTALADGEDAEINAARIAEHQVNPQSKAEQRGFKQGIKAVKELDQAALTELADGSTTAKRFHQLTGLKKTSKAFRESFGQTIDVYHNLPQEQAIQPEQDPSKPAVAEPSQATTPVEGATPVDSQTPGDAPGGDGVKTATQTAEASSPPPSAVREMADSTSARREDIDARRELLGLPAIPDAESSSWEGDLNQAKKTGIPERALDLADAIIASPRAFSPIETAGLVVKTAAVKTEYRAARKTLTESTDPENEVEAVAAISRLEGEFNRLDHALRASGTEKGRALNNQKLQIDDQLDLIAVRARVAVGNKLNGNDPKLTPAQDAKFGDLVKQRDQALADLAAAPPGSDAAILADFKARKASLKLRTEMYHEGLQKGAALRANISAKVRAMRALMATGELSAIGRQGIFSMFSHPLRTLESVGPTLMSARSELGAQKALIALRNRPNGQLYARAGLDLHDDAADITSREETMASDVFDYEGLDGVPWMSTLREGAKTSNRAFATYINQMRADTFDQLYADLVPGGKATNLELKALAQYANVVTGRGGFGKFEGAAQLLGDTFFAPRFVSSRFQTALGVPIWNAPTNRTRKLFANEYRRMLTGFAGTVMMGMAAFGDDEDVSFETDPRSTDAFKLKIGDTRIDLLAGITQPIVLLSQLGSGQTIDHRTGKTKDDDGFRTLSRFGRKKLSPLASGVLDTLTGKNAIGQDVVDPDGAFGILHPEGMVGAVFGRAAAIPVIIGGRVQPLSYQDFLNDVFLKGEFDKETGESLGELVGLGIRTYDERKKSR